jgi:hypothetical protein
MHHVSAASLCSRHPGSTELKITRSNQLVEFESFLRGRNLAWPLLRAVDVDVDNSNGATFGGRHT